MSAAAGSVECCSRRATPTGASWPSARQHDQQERDVLHPVHTVDEPPDHRVIELIEHLEEPVAA